MDDLAVAYARLICYILQTHHGGELVVNADHYNKWEAGHVDGLLKTETIEGGMRMTCETGTSAQQIREMVNAPTGRPN